MHLMSGNLSFQIEHHLFPDLPSNRYAEVAPMVQALFEKYDLNYHSASLPRQVGSAWHKIVRLSLPNGWLEQTHVKNAPQQAGLPWKLATGRPKVRRAYDAAQRRAENQRKAPPRTPAAPHPTPTQPGQPARARGGKKGRRHRK